MPMIDPQSARTSRSRGRARREPRPRTRQGPCRHSSDSTETVEVHITDSHGCPLPTTKVPTWTPCTRTPWPLLSWASHQLTQAVYASRIASQPMRSSLDFRLALESPTAKSSRRSAMRIPEPPKPESVSQSPYARVRTPESVRQRGSYAREPLSTSPYKQELLSSRPREGGRRVHGRRRIRGPIARAAAHVAAHVAASEGGFQAGRAWHPTLYTSYILHAKQPPVGEHRASRGWLVQSSCTVELAVTPGSYAWPTGWPTGLQSRRSWPCCAGSSPRPRNKKSLTCVVRVRVRVRIRVIVVQDHLLAHVIKRV